MRQPEGRRSRSGRPAAAAVCPRWPGASLCAAPAQARRRPEALVARARKLELDTKYVPPPGDPLTHHAAGCAR
jgi:hypothetical protein